MSSKCELTSFIKKYLKEQKIKPKYKESSNKYIYIIDSSEETNLILTKLQEYAGTLYEKMPVIGIDTETTLFRPQKPLEFNFNSKKSVKIKGDFSKIPSLIQIAVSPHIVFIFRCFKMCCKNGQDFNPNLFPSRLQAILKTPNVAKCGIAFSRDAEELHHYFNCNTQNIINLDVLAKGMGLKKQSLAALSYYYCNVTLNKDKRLLRTDWDGELEDMSEDAIKYAGNDAIYALKIFKKMCREPKKIPSELPDFGSTCIWSLKRKAPSK